MEFICVLSVDGALASYQVQKESETNFVAVLRNSSGVRQNLPEQIKLTKEGGNWQAHPLHEEVVRGITHAIDAV